VLFEFIYDEAFPPIGAYLANSSSDMPIFNENVYDLLILFKAVESTPPADFLPRG
jgi:hypothetical protein